MYHDYICNSIVKVAHHNLHMDIYVQIMRYHVATAVESVRAWASINSGRVYTSNSKHVAFNTHADPNLAFGTTIHRMPQELIKSVLFSKIG